MQEIERSMEKGIKSSRENILDYYSKSKYFIARSPEISG